MISNFNNHILSQNIFFRKIQKKSQKNLQKNLQKISVIKTSLIKPTFPVIVNRL